MNFLSKLVLRFGYVVVPKHTYESMLHSIADAADYKDYIKLLEQQLAHKEQVIKGVRKYSNGGRK